MSNSALNQAPKVSALKTGISKTDTKTVAEAVSNALADSFTLYLKTLGVHWNVVGASFYGLHKLTQAQYEDLDVAIDAMAERVRALGHLAPASFGDFAKRSVIKSESTIATADEMINELVADNEAIARRMREAVKIADDADDVFTADMLTARIGVHEQNIWMLSAHNAG